MRKTVKVKQTVAFENKTLLNGETVIVNSEDAKWLSDKGLVDIIGDASPEDEKEAAPVKSKGVTFTSEKEGELSPAKKKEIEEPSKATAPDVSKAAPTTDTPKKTK